MPEISRAVQMQYMRPSQLEAAARQFPVVYVPFGLIEWHGPHLPLGNDAIKAHAILVRCAELHGGVIYPPVYLHSGFRQEHLVPALTDLFERLKKTGFRVVVGVTGHNIEDQLAMINAGLEPAVSDGTIMGIALWEVSLSRSENSDTDHAAKWETSNLLYLYPDLVDLAALGEGALDDEARQRLGIWGLDPRTHASA